MSHTYVNLDEKVFAISEERLIELDYFNYITEENAKALKEKGFSLITFAEFKEVTRGFSLKDMSYFNEIRVRHTLKDNKDKEARLKPIREYFDRDRHERLIDIIEISEELQVAHFISKWNGTKEERYMPFIKYKATQETFYSLELAIISAICYKSNSNQATYWIGKMIGLDTEPKTPSES